MNARHYPQCFFLLWLALLLSTSPLVHARLPDLPAPPSAQVSWVAQNMVYRVPPADIVMPVVQDIVVLATGHDAYNDNLDKLNLPQQREDHRYTTITVGVSTKQAALIRTAKDKGELVAFLRNRDDRTQADFIGITPQDLFLAATAIAAAAQLREAAAAAGATIDANGNWVTADGRVIDKHNLLIGPDGSVSTADGKVLAGVGAAKPKVAAAIKTRVRTAQGAGASGQLVNATRFIDLIIGGSSSGGVAKVTPLPIED